MLEEIIRPMYTGEGYNVWNTAFIILVFSLSTWLFWNILGRKLDWSFKSYSKYIPVIFLSVLLRVARDFGLANSILLVTPWVWLIGLGVGIIYHYSKAARFLVVLLSSLIVGYYLRFLSIKPGVLLIAPAVAFAWLASKWLRFIDFPSFAAQMFDATTTYLGLSAGLYEEHVVARYFTSLLGPAGIFVLKIPVLLALYHLLKKEGEFPRFLIFLVGLGPGIRNLLIYLSTP